MEGVEFEDLPLDEQNELIGTYNENLKVHNNGKAKRTYKTDKIACDSCGAFQSPQLMPQHQKSKKCQRIETVAMSTKEEQKNKNSGRGGKGGNLVHLAILLHFPS